MAKPKFPDSIKFIEEETAIIGRVSIYTNQDLVMGIQIPAITLDPKLNYIHVYGYIALYGGKGDEVIRLDSVDGLIKSGGCGTWGNLLLKTPDDKESMLVSSGGHIHAGGNGITGSIVVKGSDGKDSVKLDAVNDPNPSNSRGKIVLKDAGGKDDIQLESGHYENGNWKGARITLKKDGIETISLQGEEGDLILAGADCAEEFDVGGKEMIDYGAVMVINEEGKLVPCKEPYDKKVIGVVSGGNGYKPGLILDKNNKSSRRLPIGLLGKVFCKVDARYSPIEIGDLLTTSPTMGHAMKAIDPAKSFGSVIGKAMKSHIDGRGLIPIVVTLQ